MMKRLFIFVLSAAIALSLAACANHPDSVQSEPDASMMVGGDPATWGPAGDSEDTGDAVQIPNPWVDCESLEEAGGIAGISIQIPEAVDGYGEPDFRAIDGELLEVLYPSREDDDRLCVRKAAGDEDISGDYNSYPQTTTVDVNGQTVTMRGRDDRIMVAIWTGDGYTYAVGTRNGLGSEEMTALIQAVK